jgi:hypothetical protein
MSANGKQEVYQWRLVQLSAVSSQLEVRAMGKAEG